MSYVDTENIEINSSITTVSGGDTALTIPLIDYDTVYSAVYDASMAAAADSLPVTDGQTINSTALTYFSGVLENKFIPQDYVIWVGEEYTYQSGMQSRSAYEYCMAYGDLDCNGSYFTGVGTIIRIRTSGDVSVDYEYNTLIAVDAPLYYSKSNLGEYSGIVQYDWFGFYILLSLCIGGITWFIKKLLRISF